MTDVAKPLPGQKPETWGQNGTLGDLLGPVWRLAWWNDLETNQPEVAARLVAKFPEKYPLTSERLGL